MCTASGCLAGGVGMRLLLYTPLLAPWRRVHWEAVCRRFPGEVHFVASSEHRRLYPECGTQAIELENTRSTLLPAVNSRFLGRWYNPGLLSTLRRNRYDVVLNGDYEYLSNLIVSEFALRAQTPCVMYSPTTRMPDNYRSRVLFRNGLMQTALNLVRYTPWIERSLSTYRFCVVPTSTSMDHLVNDRGVDPSRVVLIPNAIDIGAFRFDCHEPKPFVNVLYVGRFLPEKGPMLAYRAFAQVASQHATVRLTMVGQGPLREEVERAASADGLRARVDFLGQLDFKAMATVYRNASAILFTSVPVPGNVDQDPKVVLEAMASGVPVVAFDIDGGVRDSLREGRGLRVPIGDTDAMAVAVLSVLRDETRMGRMGEMRMRAAAWVRDVHNPDVVGNAYVRLLLEAVGVHET